jgi:hypothetical protein
VHVEAAQQAIGYAQESARFRIGEIRVLDSSGKVERTITFLELEKVTRESLRFQNAE